MSDNKQNGFQSGFFEGASSLKTQVIKRPAGFNDLFKGYKKMRAISYIASPVLLLEFLEKRGYEEIEIVIGDNLAGKNLADNYKNDLERRGTDAVERLASYVDNGKLRVLIPDRTIHTKFYILENDTSARVIQTSANLTETAQAARQVNYAWYLDLPVGDQTLDILIKDYQMHCEDCTLFMQDLEELLKDKQDTDKKQTIEFWLKGVVAGEQDTETKRVFNELVLQVGQNPTPKEEQAVVLRLPDAPKAKKQVERLLEPLKPALVSDNRIQVSSSAYIRYVYETHHVPLMILNSERGEVLLGLDGQITSLTEAPASPESVSQALEHVESYMNTVDTGISSDPLAAKTSMFEALLYMFFAPFAHSYMKAKRSKYGLVEKRGPRFLYIYGPAQNGKTTFLRFSLKLLTGRIMEPLTRQDFTGVKIMNTSLKGTSFPLVFDDVNPSGASINKIEDVFKSYWEQWWQDQFVSPQIIIASNNARLREWAKSRVKRVDFDVHFAPDEAVRAKLNELFEVDNPLFKWFSHLYLKHLVTDASPPSDDELYLARTVMKEIYSIAKRPLPRFFPPQPVEKIYDSGRRDWYDLLNKLKKAGVQQQGNRLLIEFSKDMQSWEVKDYQGYLPQTIKSTQKGNTLIIDNPKDFREWLKPASGKLGFFARLFK